MEKPDKLSFPLDLEKEPINFLALEDSIWAVFDDNYESTLTSKNDVFFFANVFDDIGDNKSIYVEYVWHNKLDFIIITSYTIFDTNAIPDNILDRLNDLKANKDNFDEHMFKWG